LFGLHILFYLLNCVLLLNFLKGFLLNLFPKNVLLFWFSFFTIIFSISFYLFFKYLNEFFKQKEELNNEDFEEDYLNLYDPVIDIEELES
jgi:hypothetical protein